MRRLRNIEGMISDLEPEYTSSVAPKILTKNTELPSLSALDAGDIIECYALHRNAKLENSDSLSPSALTVQKSAIAFRYKPKSTSPDAVVKAPFELTLEYGPQRTGSTQSFEAMPSVNGHHRDLEYEDGDGMYVSWENHAKIYYSQSIDGQNWENAYYMAPITGAVLSKILTDYIMEYPTLHPRYQPFTVVEKKSGKPVLNSSNSEDFVWNVFRKLADMYVAVDPILAPKRYAIELTVENVERDVKRLDSGVVVTSSTVENESGASHERSQNVANRAADFYFNFYLCVEAIKTGDYSKFIETVAPIAAPSAAPSSSPTIRVTDAPTVKVTEKNVEDEPVDEETDTKETNDNKNEGEEIKEESNIVEEINTQPDTDGENEDGGLELRNLRALSDVSSQIDSIENDLNDPLDTSDDVDNVLPFVDDAKEQAKNAENAAEEAVVSAHDEEAKEKAEIALEAAKKASQATSEAAAAILSDNLLSGDGDLMANALQNCFTDPVYGIAGADSLTNAYLYVDGSHYYRLNLTAPYLRVQSSVNTLPKPVVSPDGKSDVVDYGLAFLIIGCFCFGLVVMLHHIRVLDWDERLQFRWFFHPTSSGKKKKTKRGGYSNTQLHDDDSVSTDDDMRTLELPER
jgi:hypothetical protein